MSGSQLVLSTLRINRRYPDVYREFRDICRMHARIVDATLGMPEHPEARVLWAQPFPWTLVIRAAEPVTWQRLPSGYATEISHRPWSPPSAGPHRAVMICNPCHQRTVLLDDGSRRNVRTPIQDRAAQVAWLHGLLDPMVAGLEVQPADWRVRQGRHRDGHNVRHGLLTVRLRGSVTAPEQLALIVTRGLGRARAYGGGLSIWEPLP